MSSKIHSVSQNTRLMDGIEEMADQLKSRNQEIELNTKELVKINERIKTAEQEKLIVLEKEIIELQKETQWVRSSEPAIDTSIGSVLKKLNIL